MHNAIWLDAKNQVSIQTIKEQYTPQSGEILVEVLYSGINPADIKHGTLGFNNCVAGYDYAGIILESQVDGYRFGNKIVGLGAPLMGKPIQYGSHQRFHVARHMFHHVPEGVPMAEAACMPVVTQTAADAIYNQLEISTDGTSKQTPILIWGGSSGVGVAAIQLAKRGGCFPIITTSSTKNHAALLKLGADECFDYKDVGVVAKIRSFLIERNLQLRHVMDCVGSALTCEAVVSNQSSEVLFTNSIPSKDAKQNWRRAFACRNTKVDFHLPNGISLIHEPQPDWQKKLDEAMEWALSNYGKGYCIPNARIVKGQTATLKALEDSAAGKASFEKFVIEHPL